MKLSNMLSLTGNEAALHILWGLHRIGLQWVKVRLDCAACVIPYAHAEDSEDDAAPGEEGKRTAECHYLLRVR